jgi:hypothetical protein
MLRIGSDGFEDILNVLGGGEVNETVTSRHQTHIENITVLGENGLHFFRRSIEWQIAHIQ